MKIRILDLDDWVGLYINDKLAMEGHDLRLKDVVEELLPDADVKLVFASEDIRHCKPIWEYDYLEEK